MDVLRLVACESVTLSHSGVTFTGTWIWAALPVYTVSYTFVSGSSGRTLPNGVLAKLPMPSSGVAGDVITPEDSFRAYHMVEGAWRFTGWDKSSQTIAGGDLTFVGAWRWYNNNVVVTPVPAITPTPCPTPCPTTAPAATDAPAPSPEHQPPVQALEQMPGDPPTPMANDGTGGTAQMAIATVLAALVAAQAFAIGSDLKVLKWYNAKKAARRAGA